jgi:glutamate-1-semialdehyde 2,1-aminomutase
VPFNDLAALEEVLERFRGQIAGLIIEPVLGNIGPVLPGEGYLQGVRELTEDQGVLLIFDEVITGFRLSLGGAQRYYRIKPDLTTLGKIIGGGFPIGIFGGRRDLMEEVAPSGGIYQAGTFNGSPVPLAAGLKTLEVLERGNLLASLNRRGEDMRRAIREIVEDHRLNYSVVGIASIFKVFFGPEPHSYAETLRCDKAGYLAFFQRMLSAGIFLTPSQYETDFLSTAHDDETDAATLEAFKSNLKG